MAKSKKITQPFWVENVGIQNKQGHEIPDPNPLELPIGAQRPPTLQETVARLMRNHQMLQGNEEIDTWEDMNDFDVEDDFDPQSPWETFFDPHLGREVTAEDYQKNYPLLRDEMKKRLRNHYRAMARAEQEEELLEKARGVRGAPPSPSSDPPGEPQKP